MALLHQAQLTPTKLELLQAWMPNQLWVGDADTSTLELLGAFRFDDPEGEVGIETHLVRLTDGAVAQAPVTYRSAPLADREAFLIATMQHSVLGQRWVYDGCGDPAYAQALATAILTGGTEAELEVATDAGLRRLESSAHVAGSGQQGATVPRLGPPTCATEGATTIIRTDELELAVVRIVGAAAPAGAARTLVGTWPGQDAPALLCFLPG